MAIDGAPLETTLTRLAVPSRSSGIAVGIRAEDFEAIVREHQRRIYRVLVTLVHDPDAADTLTQECFLRAYQKRASFRGEASVGTWLVRIAVHLAADHFRNRRRAFWSRLIARREDEDFDSIAREVRDPLPSPERALLANEDLAQVRATVDALPARQRATFLLRFVEEMSFEEIAQALELELGTVKSHLHRALEAVRRRFKERGTR